MDDVKLAQNGGRVGGEDHLLEVVDDDFVAAIWTQGGLDGGGDCAAGVNVAVDGAIFGVVAKDTGVSWLSLTLYGGACCCRESRGNAKYK